MPVDFSIKQVPDEVADRLRARARRHHRSLQGELRAVLEAASAGPEMVPVEVADAEKPSATSALVREQLTAYAVLPGRSTRIVAPASEAALMIREGRDGRTLTVDDVFDRLSAIGAGTPNESVAWIRKLRNSR